LRIYRTVIFLIVLVLVTGSFYYASSSAVGTRPQSVSVAPAQTQPPVYCVYQYQFLVIKVQVSPGNTQAGASLDVTLQLEYIDGSPVKLSSEEGDFLLLGTNYSHVYQKITVTPTGNPGEYHTSLPLASDIPMGYYKVYCVHCTFTDGSGNWAPNSDTSSDETSLGTDNSAFLIGPATATTATGPSTGTLSASLLVGLGILLLIVILIAALLLRRRKK
jgi:LPXTG-motif cell wall-anchored protein